MSALRWKARSALPITKGARVMDSTPPAMASSISPARMARAAAATASNPDAHKRFSVTPGTCAGSPLSSKAMRATLRLSSPAWFAQPMNTSSTASPMAALRTTSCLIAAAARSSARTRASAPSKRPMGVRTKSQMKASVIDARFTGGRTLRLGAFEKAQQLAPRALGLRFVVDGFARLQRHVLHAPAMQAAVVNFDFRRKLRRLEGFIQLELRIGLPLIVIHRNAEVVLRLDFRHQQMRAVRLVGHQPAAVKRGTRADSVGIGGGRLHGHRTAHAVAEHPDLRLLGDRGLRIEEFYVRRGVLHDGVAGQRRAQHIDFGAVRRVVEIDVERQTRRLGRAVKRIRHQYGESAPGHAPCCGRTSAASQTPAGVVTCTSVSIVSAAAPEALAAAATPAAMDSAVNSRRERVLGSSDMGEPPVVAGCG